VASRKRGAVQSAPGREDAGQCLGNQHHECHIEVQRLYRRPVQLSQTGRTVWWTGRVAIGLRYQGAGHCQTQGQNALWLQGMLLRRA
jgi:hypothetical protein